MGGIMQGYNISSPGFLAGMNDFLYDINPDVLEQKKQAWGNIFCKYLPRLVVFLTYLPLVLQCISRFFTVYLCRILDIRSVLRVSCACIVVGVVLACIFPSVFYLGSSIVGCGVGHASMAMQIYLYEASSQENRGRLDPISSSYNKFGVLVAGIVSYVVTTSQPWGWRAFYAIGGGIAFTVFVASLIVVPVPTIQQAEQPFRKICRRRHRPALVISCANQIYGTLAGGVIISFFTPSIFSQLKLYEKTYIVYMVVSGVVGVIGLRASLTFLPRFGRRICLLMETIAMICSLAACTWVFHVYMDPDVKMDLVRTSCILSMMYAYVLSYTVCFGGVSWVSGQVSFPEDIMWIRVSLTTCCSIPESVIIAQIITSVLCKLHAYTFIIFIGINITQFAFIYCFIPETNGIKTTEEMENRIWRRHRYWKRFMTEEIGSFPLSVL